MFRSFILIVCVLLLSCLACGKNEALLVYATSALQDVFTELQPAAEKACGRRIVYFFAGSGVLRQQLEKTAAADVFVSASIYEMEMLAKNVPLAAGTRSDILGNTLVVVGQPDASPAADKAALRALLDAAPNFAMGDPELVSLGRYTDNVLRKLNLTRSTNGRVILGKSARQVLSYVEAGVAKYGFAFGSGAQLSGNKGNSSLIYTFSDDDLRDEPIRFLAAVLGHAPRKSAARKFVTFLKSDEARSVFTNAGFRIP